MGTNILVIEDNVIALDELEYRLHSMGYNVATAVNYDEAIEKAKTFIPNIILSDINLGDGMDGIATVTKIQRKQSVPVIYLTAYDDNETLKRAQTTDPYAYIIKPVKEKELRIAVDIALNKDQHEQELRALNDTKNKLFSIIGHDLSSPYASIYGLSKLLKDRMDEFSTDELKQYIDLIYESSNRGVNLSQNLVNWSRAQLNGVVINKTEVNLSAFIDGVIQDYDEFFTQKNITVYNLVDTNINVFIDTEIIVIVLRNLLSNATKFTPENGNIKLINNLNDNSDMISVCVVDDGVGMTNDQLSKLFKLEHKSSSLGTNHERGNGMGLLLCKEFIEAHGNKIWAESNVKKGSKFSFTLPLTDRFSMNRDYLY